MWYPSLADNSRELCVGSDPHFAIRLPGGSLLCYTFQGRYNAIFNLVSNDQLQMNALFVPDDTAYNNTWLGSIGISILDDGKKATTLQFTAADQLVRIGERVQLDARTVKKLSFQKGKLSVVEVPSNHTPRYPRVQVEFIDSELDFTVRFAKNNHLDLYWHSTGLFDNSRGVVGECDHSTSYHYWLLYCKLLQLCGYIFMQVSSSVMELKLMNKPSFFECLVVFQCQWSTKTCGNSWSKVFTVTPSVGHLLTIAAKERALLQEPTRITSLMIF